MTVFCNGAHCYVIGGVGSRLDASQSADASVAFGSQSRLRCDLTSTCRGTLGDGASIECRGGSSCVLTAGADSISISRESSALELYTGARSTLDCTQSARCTGTLGDLAIARCTGGACDLACAARCQAPTTNGGTVRLTCNSETPGFCPPAAPSCGPCDGGFSVVDGGSDAGNVDAGSDAGAPDAGVIDAGGPDAGSTNAGLSDAGEPPQTDGGIRTPRELTVGCGCQASGGFPLLLITLAALRLRRRAQT